MNVVVTSLAKLGRMRHVDRMFLSHAAVAEFVRLDEYKHPTLYTVMTDEDYELWLNPWLYDNLQEKQA